MKYDSNGIIFAYLYTDNNVSIYLIFNNLQKVDLISLRTFTIDSIH